MVSASASTDSESSDHPLLGSVLRGTYRVVRVLDRGGMGTVFEAEHVRLRRQVAVKVLARHLTTDTQALARFHREAEIISQIQHPNVVQLLDFDSTESGEPYIVMEYLTGRSLAQLLERYGRLDVQRAARVVHQVACGLSAAHRASIVHRDLKPANIFLVDVSEEGTMVKVLDFGISKFADTERSLTGEYDIVGTPDYMAPEQALGRGLRVDHRADQYSLAVIAYEAISGHTPFVGRNVTEVLERVISNEPVPIERFVPELPTSLGPVLRRAMAKDPEERFLNVLEFAGALLAASGCSIPPPSDSRGGVRTLLLGDAPSAARTSFIAARPDGRYHTPRPRASESALTEPPGPYPATEPPGPFPETDPGALGDSAPSDENTRNTILHRMPNIDRVLDQAREAFGLGDVHLAVSYAESALHLGELLGGRAKQRVEASSTLLETILTTRIGSLDTKLVGRRVPTSHGELRLSPEQAFLLSRLDAATSVEEALDLSPLPRLETLRHLVTLLRQGLLAVSW